MAVATDDAGRPQQAVIEPVPAFSRAALADWAARRLAPGAEVYSDGLAAFRAVAAQHAHTVIEAPPGKAGDGARWVNVVLGNLKRALDGTYHAFGFFKYAERYLAEAARRFNRRFDLKTLVPRLLATAAACRPWTEAALRRVPVYSRCRRLALIRSCHVTAKAHANLLALAQASEHPEPPSRATLRPIGSQSHLLFPAMPPHTLPN